MIRAFISKSQSGKRKKFNELLGEKDSKERDAFTEAVQLNARQMKPK